LDIDLAHRLALVSGEVYRSLPRVGTILPGAGIRAFHNTGTQCYLIDHPTMVVVAFRGTEPLSLRDWGTDLQALSRLRRPGMPGAFHRGFGSAVAGIELRLYYALTRELGDRPLYLTGHSLGGALAVVFAADLVRWHFGTRISGLYTFGAPRVVTPRAAQWLDGHLRGRIHRFVNPGDPVPWMPPAVLCYRHVGEEFRLEGSRRPSFAKHSIDAYAARLEHGLAAVA
jgi:triacylglycerol lipase